MDPNYDAYSNEELRDAREYIDKNAFPERYALLNDLISSRKSGLIEQKVVADTTIDLNEKRKEIESDIRSTKVSLIIGLGALIYGYSSNTIPLPISRYESIDSTGLSFIFSLLAIMCLIINSGITCLMYKKPSFVSHRIITLNSIIKYIGFSAIVLAYLTVMGNQ